MLPPNVHTVNVFLGCQLEIAVGMSGAIYTGIQRSEVLAVCDLLDIPQAARRDVLWGIQVMVNTVLPDLNARHG